MDCLFCEIAAGRRPASVVHADDHFLAFMDIHPVSNGHVLVVPRRHAALVEELTPAERAALFELVAGVRLAQADAGFARGGANILVNDGASANQHVPHLHVHVVPRRRGDTPTIVWRFASRMLDVFGRARRREKLDAVARELTTALSRRQRERQESSATLP